jgi:cyclase
LLLDKGRLVKTVGFRRPSYIGDPCNTVRIFNELEVDELILLDIRAGRHGGTLNWQLISDISSECFMPMTYGGGVTSVEMARRLFATGVEKVSVNSAALQSPELIERLAGTFGSQAVVVSIDAKRNRGGEAIVHGSGGRMKTRLTAGTWAKQVVDAGAGEILLTSIDREGSWGGFDLRLVESVARAVSVPVIAHGGAGSTGDIAQVLSTTSASAVGLGSLVVYQRPGMGVLVNFPFNMGADIVDG